MIVEFKDSVTGTAVYINPAYVVTLRPDPAEPLHITLVKLNDGETIHVRGEHTDVADKLARSR
jgi:hypothetical protein